MAVLLVKAGPGNVESCSRAQDGRAVPRSGRFPVRPDSHLHVPFCTITLHQISQLSIHNGGRDRRKQIDQRAIIARVIQGIQKTGIRYTNQSSSLPIPKPEPQKLQGRSSGQIHPSSAPISKHHKTFVRISSRIISEHVSTKYMKVLSGRQQTRATRHPPPTHTHNLTQVISSHYPFRSCRSAVARQRS